MEHMSQPYGVLRFTRNERLPDRFLSSEIHVLDHRNKPAMLVVTLEIENQWHHASHYGTQIANNIVREYSRSQSPSDLVKFEQALKAVNGLIGQAREKLGTTINCTAVLFLEQEVHLAAIGRCCFLLYRNNRLVDVSAEDSSQDAFSSVTSGDLENGEWLMSVNHSFAQFLQNNEPEIWQEESLEAISAALIDAAPAQQRETFCGTLINYRPGQQGATHTVYWNALEHVTPIRLPKINLPQLSFTSSIDSVKEFCENAVGWVRGLRSKTEKVQLKKLSLPPLRTSSVIAGVVIVLIVVGAGSLFNQLRTPKTEAKPPTLSQELVASAVGSRVAYLNENYSFDRYQNLTDEEKETFSQALAAENISTLSQATLVSELVEPAVAADLATEQPIIIDKSGQLWRLRDGNAVKIEQSSLIQDPISVLSLSNDRILVSDQAGNVWLFESGKPQATALSLPTPLASSPKLLGKYQQNIYLYTSEANAIYRVTNFDKDLSSARVVIQANLLTGPLADIAINGDVVTLDTAGKVTGIRAGKAVHQALTIGTAAPLRVTSTEQNSRIYALSGRFLTVASPSAEVEQTFFIGEKEMPTDIALEPAGKILWLAAGKQIYKVTL